MSNFLEKGKKNKKKQELSDEIKKIKKEKGLKNLSRQEENQALLNAVKEKKNKDKEEIVEKDVHNAKRTFTCKCGVIVTLNGDIDEKITKCSKCEQEVMF